MNVCSLGSKLNYVSNHAMENELDLVVLTETWLSNEEKNNAIVVNACLDHGYTLHHRPRHDERRGGGVGVLIKSKLKITTRQMSVNENISSFEFMELTFTIVSLTVRHVSTCHDLKEMVFE